MALDLAAILAQMVTPGDRAIGLAVALVLATLVLGFILYRILVVSFLRGAPPSSVRARALRAVYLAFGFALAIFGTRWLYLGRPDLLALDEKPYEYGRRVLDTALLLIVLVGIVRVGTIVAFDWYLRTRRRLELPKVVRVPVLLSAYLILAFVAVLSLGIPVTGLIASSTVLTAVIGLALKDTLANGFSGLELYFDKTVQMGDWIEVDGLVGEVREFDWRHVRLRDTAGDAVILPTSAISNGAFVNHSRPTSLTARTVQVGVDYSAPPNRVIEILSRAAAESTLALKEPPPKVQLRSFGDSAILYEIRFFIEDFARYKDAETEVSLKTWYHLRRARIDIPFPIRTLHLVRPSRDGEPADLERRLAELRRVDFIRSLPDDAHRALAGQVDSLGYSGGERIVTQGEAGDSFFVVQSGQAAVRIEDSSGAPQTVATLGPGAYFGVMSLLTGAPRSATVVADGDVVVLRLSKEAFREMLVAHPAAAERISEVVAERVERNRQALEACEKALASVSRGPASGARLKDRLLSGLKHFLGV